VAAPVSSATSTQLLQQLGVVAVPDGFGGFVHDGAIHLIDSRGQIRQIFDYADWQSALLAAQNLPCS
jgi:protein SCO1/2